MQINIKDAERRGGETESGWWAPSVAASCLMFGYMNRDESWQYLGWGAEAVERGGGGGDEGGGAPFPKGPERLDVRHVCLRAIKHNTGILLKSVPGNLNTHTHRNPYHGPS